MSFDDGRVFDTARLAARFATEANADHHYALWTNPQAMANVGYSQGLLHVCYGGTSIKVRI